MTAHSQINPLSRQEEVAELVRASKRQQTMAGLLAAMLVHLALGGVLALLVLPQLASPEPELIVSMPAATPATQKPTKKTLRTITQPQRPAAQSSSATRVISAVATSSISVPVVETNLDDNLLGVDLGDGMGFGQGFGMSGSGTGPGMKFFGNQAEGERVAFVVDVSASMSGEQFKLMKSELVRSLNALPPRTQYQVIFFSGPVWYAHQTVSHKGRNEATVNGPDGKKSVWRSPDGKANGYTFGNGKEALPTEPWRKTSSSNTRQTIKHVEAVKKSFGTSWHQPLRMALSMDPKPDVIYFMTDGAVANAEEAVKLISRMNRRGNKSKSKIFTTAMMEPKAARQLYDLAKKNGGQFSTVLADGSVVTGRDALK